MSNLIKCKWCSCHFCSGIDLKDHLDAFGNSPHKMIVSKARFDLVERTGAARNYSRSRNTDDIFSFLGENY